MSTWTPRTSSSTRWGASLDQDTLALSRSFRRYQPPPTRFNSWITPVHTTLTAECGPPPTHQTEGSRPPPKVLQHTPEWEVDAVLGYQKVCNQIQYLVSWLGYPPESNSCELESNLINAPKKIAQYHQGKDTLEGERKTNVRNIPDINQILSKEKCWNQVDKCSTGGAKFDREFPPLSGKKKNQNSEKTDFYGNWNNLTSGQAPATLCQPPASLLPSQLLAQAGTSGPATSSLPACQPPARSPGSHQPPACPPLPQRAHCQLPGPMPQPIRSHHT
ncbi:hypothetical protein DSO57_1037653 [Entomophthora muscae]|uniref:Uncharacterized protein n=1 Tax=Entomophthora muscae TaxID=34485 RepID=A0ACC2TA71_9FUNG|nr:hypothetical protein DSO57_1037653 [Entomophthora muscae]